LCEGGDRERWRRVLLPLVPVATRPGRLVVTAAIASALVAGSIAIQVLSASRRGEHPMKQDPAGAGPPAGVTARVAEPSPPNRPPAGDLPSFTTSGPRLSAWATPAALADCQQRTQAIREEVARGELEIWRYSGSQSRFERGDKPNPAAEAELRAVLPEALRAGRVESPAFTLECHTWDCRLWVLEKYEDAARSSWVDPFKRGEALPGRLRRVGFKGGPEYRRDPLSDTGAWEVIANLALADPSGKPVARPGPPAMAVDRSPLPGTFSGCQQQLGELQRRRREQQELLGQSRNPVLHFDRARGGPQPALEREVTGHLEAIFGPAHRDIEVRCQGGFCRLRGPGVLRSRNGIDERVGRRLAGRERRHEVMDGAAYFELEPPSPASSP